MHSTVHLFAPAALTLLVCGLRRDPVWAALEGSATVKAGANDIAANVPLGVMNAPRLKGPDTAAEKTVSVADVSGHLKHCLKNHCMRLHCFELWHCTETQRHAML